MPTNAELLLRKLTLLSPAQRRQAMYKSMIAAGGQLAAASALSLQPGGAARGAAQAGQTFVDTYGNEVQRGRQRAMQGLQLSQLLAQQKRAADTHAQQQKFLQTGKIEDAPFDLRAKALLERTKYRKPGTIKVGGRVYLQNPDGTPGRELGEDPSLTAAKYTSQHRRPRTVTTGEGVYEQNPDGTLGERLGSSARVAAAKASISVAYEKKLGAAKADAQTALPGKRESAAYITKVLTDLKSHPGFSDVVGVPETISGGIFKTFDAPLWGTDAAGFVGYLRQVQGQQFLDAFQQLKGGGHITEIEGIKATESRSRLTQTGQSEEEYKAAIDELLELVQRGLRRAEAEAGGDFGWRGSQWEQRAFGGGDQPDTRDLELISE